MTFHRTTKNPELHCFILRLDLKIGLPFQHWQQSFFFHQNKTLTIKCNNKLLIDGREMLPILFAFWLMLLFSPIKLYVKFNWNYLFILNWEIGQMKNEYLYLSSHLNRVIRNVLVNPCCFCYFLAALKNAMYHNFHLCWCKTWYSRDAVLKHQQIN